MVIQWGHGSHIENQGSKQLRKTIFLNEQISNLLLAPHFLPDMSSSSQNFVLVNTSTETHLTMPPTEQAVSSSKMR